MQINSFNCRGLGNSTKADAVKYLLKMYPSEILLLQETKIEEDSLLFLNKSKWKKNAGLAVNARGSSGGLATIWSEDLFHLNNSFRTQHWIYFEFIIYTIIYPFLCSICMSMYITWRKKFVGSLC